MKRHPVFLSFLAALIGVSLLCWIVMFLAGHDIWTFAGKPDFWKLSGPPYLDVRIFAVAFYAQLFVLTGVLIVAAVTIAWNVTVVRRNGQMEAGGTAE